MQAALCPVWLLKSRDYLYDIANGVPAYAATLTQYVNDYTYPRAILVTGVETVSQESCVSFSIFYNMAASFIIRAPTCLTTFSYYGVLLETSVSTLGPQWRSIYLPIIPANDSAPCDVQLQLEVITAVYKPGLSVAIANFTLSPGACLGMYCMYCRCKFCYSSSLNSSELYLLKITIRVFS